MNECYSLVEGVEEHAYADFEYFEPVFLLQNSKQLHIEKPNARMLKYLIFSILRRPRDLRVHLQRIILCFQQTNEEQLYAALVDFFVVLRGAGLPIKRRVLAGSRKRLSSSLVQRLQTYLTDDQLIQGNNYSVLTSGQESNLELVLVGTHHKSKSDRDVLQIARDYIEYSQLDEAIAMLEAGVLASPDYIELHEDLLELYKSTKNVEAFEEMKLALSETEHPMQTQWDALSSYFNQ